MAVGLVMRFAEVGQEQYDDVMRVLGLRSPVVADVEDDWPDGAVSHVAGQAGDGWCVIDVWKSREQFETFMRDRLMPALQKVGTLPPPEITEVEIYNMHGTG